MEEHDSVAVDSVTAIQDRDPVGIRIARARQLKGLTQKELAAELGVAESTIANWERGAAYPRRHWALVSEALGIDVPRRSPAAAS